MAGFCIHCGSPLSEGAAFCINCGTRLETLPSTPAQEPVPEAASTVAPEVEATLPAEPPAPVAPQPDPAPVEFSPASDAAVVSPPPQVPPPSKSGNTFVKVVAIVLGIFALVTVAAIGGCIYIGYRVKHKAEQFTSDLKKQVTQPQGSQKPKGEVVNAQPCPAVPPEDSQSFRTAAAAASIPLKPGLTLVDIWSNKSLKGRDVEVLTSVQEVGDSTVAIQAARAEPGSASSSRTLCIADLLKARQYVTGFGKTIPTTISGATMFSMPRVVFDDWKAARPAALNYFEASTIDEGQYTKTYDAKGQLSRVEPDDVPYSVVVNGDRKDLPAIHVKGMLGDKATEAYVLDDPADPVTLSWNVPSTNFHVKYTKITFPVEKKVEQELSQGCAAVYGIYFNFDSAQLRSESGPALKEIAEALTHNPAWKVRIEGHTDNVGGDTYNLNLSTRRAEAVKQDLLARYQVSAGRLSSQGFGASKPKATNDTEEGRALNRRVELCRQ